MTEGIEPRPSAPRDGDEGGKALHGTDVDRIAAALLPRLEKTVSTEVDKQLGTAGSAFAIAGASAVRLAPVWGLVLPILGGLWLVGRSDGDASGATHGVFQAYALQLRFSYAAAMAFAALGAGLCVALGDSERRRSQLPVGISQVVLEAQRKRMLTVYQLHLRAARQQHQYDVLRGLLRARGAIAPGSEPATTPVGGVSPSLGPSPAAAGKSPEAGSATPGSAEVAAASPAVSSAGSPAAPPPERLPVGGTDLDLAVGRAVATLVQTPSVFADFEIAKADHESPPLESEWFFEEPSNERTASMLDGSTVLGIAAIVCFIVAGGIAHTAATAELSASRKESIVTANASSTNSAGGAGAPGTNAAANAAGRAGAAGTPGTSPINSAAAGAPGGK